MAAGPESYVLVTPMKNEGQMLQGLFDSVLGQSLRPVLWVIGDDGSTDDGYGRARGLSSSQPWVLAVSREEVPNHPWIRYASSASFAIGEALRAAESRGLLFDFIAVLDADTVVEKDYFRRLMERMMDEPNAGIASGLIATEGGGGLESKPSPRGCARMYRKSFLETVGGFPVSASPDTVLEIKAVNRRRGLVVVPDASGTHRRKSTMADGAAGLRSRGVVRYVLGMDLASTMAWTYVYARSVGFREAGAFFRGYLEGVRRRYPKIQDQEVLDYFRGSWRRYFWKKETRSAVKDVLR